MANQRDYAPQLHGLPGESFTVGEETRTLMRVGKTTVWYQKPNGTVRHMSLHSWQILRAGLMARKKRKRL